MKNIVILGGGLAGLAASYELSKDKNNITLIESTGSLGGLAKTLKKGDYSFDYGPHALYTKEKEVYNLVKKLLGKDLTNLGERDIKILFQGKIFEYPLKVQSVLMKLNIFTSFRCLFDYVVYNLRRIIFHPKEVSFEDWIKNRFGKKLYHIFFRDYTHKVWGIHPNKLDKSFASERIPQINIFNILLSFFKKEKRSRQLSSKNFSPDHLYYPKYGVSQIIEKLHKNIKNKININLNTTFDSFELEDRKVKSIICKKNNKNIKIPCDYVLSTIPLTSLDKSSRLVYRKVNFVFLVIDKPSVFDSHWVYFHNLDVLGYRVYDTSAFSKYMMPKGKTGLCIEVSEYVKFKDKKELVTKVIDDFLRLKLFKKSDVLASYTDELTHGYPIYTIGYKKSLNNILSKLSSIPNLLTIGRQGLFRYIDMDHCFVLAKKVREQLLNDHLDQSEFDIKADHGSKKE